jgi:DNA-binding NarL/FixJ family response regulator
MCFLAQKYELTPREVTLIALITSGKSGRAISQTLGIGMLKIRQHCAGFMARLAPIRGSQSVYAHTQWDGEKRGPHAPEFLPGVMV